MDDVNCVCLYFICIGILSVRTCAPHLLYDGGLAAPYTLDTREECSWLIFTYRLAFNSVQFRFHTHVYTFTHANEEKTLEFDIRCLEVMCRQWSWAKKNIFRNFVHSSGWTWKSFNSIWWKCEKICSIPFISISFFIALKQWANRDQESNDCLQYGFNS